MRTLPDTPFDVVIVGARAAGAATALLLSQTGHRVLVVDRGRYGTDTLSTHALMRGGVVQLHRWKVLPAIIAAGTPPVRQATFFYGDESVTVPISSRDGIDALYAPRRYVLDRLLIDAAVAAGATVAYGHQLKGLKRSASGRVAGVVLENQFGRLHDVSSPLVVGADGLWSSVARMTGATVYREGRHATATMYGHFRGLDVAGYEWYFVPGIGAGAIPTNDGETCVFVAVPATAFTRLFAHQPEEAFHQLLREAAPGLANQILNRTRREDGPRLRGFSGHRGFFRHAHGPGWALVGDAGYFKDPLTSHGITDALRDAEALAHAIDAGSDEALEQYQATRDAASEDLFETTDAIASFSWNLNEVKVLHERLSRSMSRELGTGLFGPKVVPNKAVLHTEAPCLSASASGSFASS